MPRSVLDSLEVDLVVEVDVIRCPAVDRDLSDAAAEWPRADESPALLSGLLMVPPM